MDSIRKEEIKIIVRNDFDVEKFAGLTDKEIEERFNKKLIPELIKKIRMTQKDDDCPVCSPWTYAFF